MKFICEKALLLGAITTASRTVAVKSSIPSMEGILIEAADQLYLTGYNLETGIRTTAYAEILETGSLVISARLLGDIVRKMPDAPIVCSTEHHMVKLECGPSHFHIMGMDPKDFPELPSIEQENSLSLPQGLLKSMIAQTIFAVSDNESRPIHTGSLFEIDHNQLTVVSVDGYRLALRREQLTHKEGAESFSFVVPRAALVEIEKICSGEELVQVSQGTRHILVQGGTTTLVCRRLEGEFLAYRNAIPEHNPIAVICDTQKLRQSIERVSLIISETLKSPLRCLFEEGQVLISTKTSLGDAQDVCQVVGDGEQLEIGFNHKYLMDALKAAPSAQVRLEFSSGVAPCIFRPAEGGDAFLYMVLPVRLKAI